MRIFGGLANFRDPGHDGLCRTMTFSRGVQTPDNTMLVVKVYTYSDLGQYALHHILSHLLQLSSG